MKHRVFHRRDGDGSSWVEVLMASGSGGAKERGKYSEGGFIYGGEICSCLASISSVYFGGAAGLTAQFGILLDPS